MTVEFRWDESGKYYDFDSACAALQEWVTSAKCTISGYFEGQGEEGERFRYRFEGGAVHYDLPKTLWPGDPGYDTV